MALLAREMGGRNVLLGEPGDCLGRDDNFSFVVLVPARCSEEVEEVLRLAKDWVRAGCREICCIGSEAEHLHDELDKILEESGLLDVVTTWNDDMHEACEYFLFGAGAQRLVLLALIVRWPELIKTLSSVAEGE